MRLYGDLHPWYPLLDPVADHAEEVAAYVACLREHLGPGRHRLLELGAGAGNNAFHLKAEFDCTLNELSPDMQALSLAQNPECVHLPPGDLCSLRLEDTFDAVLLHDAVAYMHDLPMLQAALATLWHHTRPGGCALVVPDTYLEDFEEATEVNEAEDESGRALRCLTWSWAPTPGGSLAWTEYILALREGEQVQVVHDRHPEGLFSRATWVAQLEALGFQVAWGQRPHGDGTDDDFLVARRPN